MGNRDQYISVLKSSQIIIFSSRRRKKKSVSIASKYKFVNIGTGFSPIIYCKFSQKIEINCQLLPSIQEWYQEYIFLVHWAKERLNLTQALSFSKKHLTLLMNGHTVLSSHYTESSKSIKNTANSYYNQHLHHCLTKDFIIIKSGICWKKVRTVCYFSRHLPLEL